MSGVIADRTDGRLHEGDRVGRFVVLRDIDGRTHAVAAGSVAAVCETEEGTLLMLPGARLLHVPRAMATVLAWLDGRGGGRSSRPLDRAGPQQGGGH